MYRDLLIIIAVVSSIIFASIKCNQRCKKLLQKLNVFSNYCSDRTIIYKNIFQYVFSYTNEYFTEFVIICTFKKLFDPTQWFILSDDTVIIKGRLNKRVNSFIYKKSYSIHHLATTFLTKQKDDTYKVFGNKHFLSFVKKYKVEKFYITFLPQKYVTGCEFRTEFYMELKYSNINDKMVDELFETISNLQDCGDERFKELKKRYEVGMGSEIMKLNIKERSEKMIEERQASGVDYNRRKNKKTQKMKVKNK